jgi:hypothetical protein
MTTSLLITIYPSNHLNERWSGVWNGQGALGQALGGVCGGGGQRLLCIHVADDLGARRG